VTDKNALYTLAPNIQALNKGKTFRKIKTVSGQKAGYRSYLAKPRLSLGYQENRPRLLKKYS